MAKDWKEEEDKKSFKGQIGKVLLKNILFTEDGCPVCGEKQAKMSPLKGGQGFSPLCGACVGEYIHPEYPRCRSCGKIIALAEKGEICSDCREGRGPKDLNKVTALGIYQGEWKEFILKIKFAAQPRLLAGVARPLAHWAVAELYPPDGIVPVPMYPRHKAERGFNQTDVIASLLHWELGLPILKGLERVEDTPSQVALSRAERLENLRYAFAVRGGEGKDNWAGKSVWLIDDVVTTGATLEACALALKEAGVKNVAALCLAAGCEKSLVRREK